MRAPDPVPAAVARMLASMRQLTELVPPLTGELDVLVEEVHAKRKSVQALQAELGALDRQLEVLERPGPANEPAVGVRAEPPRADLDELLQAMVDLARLAIEENQGPITHLSLNEPARGSVTAFAAQVAEVEVDPATGQVKVRKITTVHDAGTVLNHLTFQGQVDGGVVTGLGFGLMEETPVVDGRIAALNLGEFKIPTAQDIPKLTTHLLQSPTGPVPFQGKAIAEIPNVPTAAAVANAIADAVGVRLFELPLTAEKIYGELKQERK